MVLIGSLPAARMSDMATCAGPPDVIVKGAATVFIGGLPAARQLDITAHGGLITLGCPTVLIGDPPILARPITQVKVGNETWWRVGTGTYVRPDAADPTFESAAIAALVRLDTTSNMKAAFNAIEASGNYVVVQPYVPPAGWGPFNAYCAPYNSAGAQTPGVGSNSTVAWDPGVNGFGPAGTTPDSSQPGADIILAHELIHGTHNAQGKQPAGPINADQINVHEERNTVGLPAGTYNRPGDPLDGTALPDTQSLPYTENGVRAEYAERGIKSPVTGNPPVQRPSYYDPTPTGGAGSPF